MELPSLKTVLIIALVVLMLTWIGINKLAQPVYDLGACTINDFDCGIAGWDGICTDEIKDDCCDPVRVCAGQMVDDPLDCYDDYCWEVGKKCIPEYDVALDKYKCTCKVIVA